MINAIHNLKETLQDLSLKNISLHCSEDPWRAIIETFRADMPHPQSIELDRLGYDHNFLDGWQHHPMVSFNVVGGSCARQVNLKSQTQMNCRLAVDI